MLISKATLKDLNNVPEQCGWYCHSEDDLWWPGIPFRVIIPLGTPQLRRPYLLWTPAATWMVEENQGGLSRRAKVIDRCTHKYFSSAARRSSSWEIAVLSHLFDLWKNHELQNIASWSETPLKKTWLWLWKNEFDSALAFDCTPAFLALIQLFTFMFSPGTQKFSGFLAGIK